MSERALGKADLEEAFDRYVDVGTSLYETAGRVGVRMLENYEIMMVQAAGLPMTEAEKQQRFLQLVLADARSGEELPNG